MRAAVRKLRSHLTMLAFLVVYVSILVGCENRETILMIEKPTDVYSIDQTPAVPGSSGPTFQPGKVIMTLKAGESARADGVYHGQDYDGFKVKLADGTEGIILAGETFKVLSR